MIGFTLLAIGSGLFSGVPEAQDIPDGDRDARLALYRAEVREEIDMHNVRLRHIDELGDKITSIHNAAVHGIREARNRADPDREFAASTQMVVGLLQIENSRHRALMRKIRQRYPEFHQ